MALLDVHQQDVYYNQRKDFKGVPFTLGPNEYCIHLVLTVEKKAKVLTQKQLSDCLENLEHNEKIYFILGAHYEGLGSVTSFVLNTQQPTKMIMIYFVLFVSR